MTGRRLSAFIEAIATGRRPKRFRASLEDAEILRAAIDLRAARPGEAEPSTAFTEGLFRQLSEQTKQAEQRQEPTPIRAATRPRARTVLLAAAAVVALVAGTAAATEALTSQAPAHSAVQVPRADALRTGTFLTDDGQVLGQIVAYRGSPSWVFMNVAVPNYNGPVKCMLQVDDGSTVAFGTFTVQGGTGQFAKSIGSVDVGHLRGAKLVTPTGSPVADATFAA
jgi:hypothetical protein